MKLILKEYLASLRERGDLDKVLLPNLLSALGLQVIKTPMIGTRQDGVDIAAVGRLESDQEKYVYLFCIKAGDVGRNDWDGGGAQTVRPELQEILDVYISTRIADEHKSLPIKVCLCMGGELKETVETNWANFTKNNSSEQISFELWNGDRLAAYMEQSLLARELLEEEPRRYFQKALAMVNEPDACYEHTYSLLSYVISVDFGSEKERLLRLRQAFICVHVICAWAADAKNLDVIYRISELGLLFCWDSMKLEKFKAKPTKKQKQPDEILDQYLRLYLINSELYFQKVLYPYSGKLHALSVSVKSREAIDVNLALFELLGRLAMRAVWTDFFGKGLTEGNPSFAQELNSQTAKSLDELVNLINNNPTLRAPLKDDHMIDIALVMHLAQQTHSVQRFLPWVHTMAEQTTFALLTNAAYPTCQSDYVDLLSHPLRNDQEYRDNACVGSILYPYLFVWLQSGVEANDIDEFVERLQSKIPNCTHQAWFPDDETDKLIWRGGKYHGVCVTDVSPANGHENVAEILNEAIKKCTAVFEISAMKRGFTPLLLTACRHYRLPVPPTLWFLPDSDE